MVVPVGVVLLAVVAEALVAASAVLLQRMAVAMALQPTHLVEGESLCYCSLFVNAF